MGSGHAFPTPEEGPEAADRGHGFETRGSLTTSARLPRAHRLARPQDLARCVNEGRRRRTRHLEMIWADNLAGHARMGLIVPRFQSSAVARNRLRRRLREVWRREIQARQGERDLVIRASRQAYATTFATLRAELVAWADTTLSPLEESSDAG